jgi:hypothetical protein
VIFDQISKMNHGRRYAQLSSADAMILGEGVDYLSNLSVELLTMICEAILLHLSLGIQGPNLPGDRNQMNNVTRSKVKTKYIYYK